MKKKMSKKQARLPYGCLKKGHYPSLVGPRIPFTFVLTLALPPFSPISPPSLFSFPHLTLLLL